MEEKKMVFEEMTIDEILYDYLGINDDPENLEFYFTDDFMREFLAVYFFASKGKMDFFLTGYDDYLPENAKDVIHTEYFILFRHPESCDEISWLKNS